MASSHIHLQWVVKCDEVQVIGDGFTQFGNGALNTETGMAVYGL